ncbi:MAG: 16S rRNA (cytosine(1402)-N(4))-methyltransferase RsmH [Phycisphaerae bacterium]
MKPGAPNGDNCDDRPARPRRRTRYAGTHPRRFYQRYKELAPDLYPEIREHVLAQGRTPAGTHVPVLVEEVIAALRPGAGDIVVDCTLGYGGHAGEFLRRIGPAGRLIGLDVDALQLERTAQRLGGAIHDQANRTGTANHPRICLHRCHFGGIGKVLARERLEFCDTILADLGASSMQLDDPTRGFSYKHDGLLDMRMDDRLLSTAADLLATLSKDELSAKLQELADEPDHERIAQAIVQRRAIQPITRTRQLARLILAVKGRSQRAARGDTLASASELHPAARTFQALRMMVNDEVGGLQQLLRVAPYCLRAGGRIGIISFHSGEHRRVQHALREGLRAGLYAVISEEPIRPTPQEVTANPRSRAARLRWAERSEG